MVLSPTTRTVIAMTDALAFAREAGLPVVEAPDQPDHDRHLLFEGAFNVRDLGGLSAGGGRRVRAGLLYRADGVHRLTSPDVARMQELGVRTVLDLRTTRELEEWGTFPATDGIAHHHLPVLRETWDRMGLDPVREEQGAVDFLAARYAEMLVEGAAALGTALGTVADGDAHAVVFHCAAGKDRTGVLAMLVLALLGVADDEIAADYHLSRHGTARWLTWVAETRPSVLEEMVDQPKAFLDSPEEVAHRVLEALRAEHGSPEAYVAGIGVDDATVERLREALLE